MKKLFLVLAGLVLISQMAWSQSQVIRCYTTEMQQFMRDQGQLLETDEQFERWLAEKMRTTDFTTENDRVIPVVFHIIYQQENNVWNISNDQVLSQLQVLNEDFLRQNADTTNTPLAFRPAAVNTGISFCLAQRDPQGNATNGIIRHQFPNTTAWSSSAFNSTVKPATIWDPTRYLNIWIANLSGGLLGYAQFPTGSGLPGLSGGNNANTDGVVVLYSSVGRPPANPFTGVYNRGRTATHEVGHYLGLRHIWGDGGCSVDDFCNDTPVSDAANYGCPTTHVSCGTVDMVQNYMDYTDDACMNIFTANQTTRMLTVLQNSPRRASLLTANSCLPAVQRPVGGFAQSADTICVGGSMSFSDQSSNQPTAWLWQFQGGTPATATTANPTGIIYNLPGTYNVTLITTNTAGSDTLVRNFAVVVQANVLAQLVALDTLCSNDQIRVLTAGMPRGGSYTGPGITNDSLFNPALAGVGTHQIVYFLPGCGSSDTAFVTVLAAPTVDLQGLANAYCLNNGPVNLTGVPAGGQFSGPGITGSQFSPTQAGAGIHTLRYRVSNAVGCEGQDSVVVIVNALPAVNASNPGPVCISTPFVLLTGASPAGGAWSGPGVSNDTLYPALAGAGTHAISYTTPAASGTGCTNTANLQVVVNQVPTVTFTPVADVCLRGNNVLMDQASISGGNYTGPGVNFGIFNPAQAGVGQHTIQFSGNSGGCAVTGSFTIRVFATDTPAIEALGTDSIRATMLGSSYRWYRDGVQLIGENTRAIRPQISGVYRVEVEQAGCWSDASGDFAYFMTSVAPAAATSFKVYPNPSEGAFMLEHAASTCSIEIRDAQGRLLQAFESSEAKLAIDLQTAAPGVYLLRYQAGSAPASWVRLVKR